MITIKLKYDVNQEYLSLISKYLRQYSSMLHVFYQLLSKEQELQSEFNYLKTDSILKQKFKQLNNIDLMNDWFCRSAIGEAYQLLKSNKDKDGNKTKVIFGGKGNFIKRCNIFNIKLLKVKPEYSSFIGNFLYRSLKLPDMILASIEISRRAYEYYNQYISRTKEQIKNIIQPRISDFRHFYKKSLEEFQIEDKSISLKELYYIFKKSKMLYRLSIDLFNLLFSRFFTPKSYMNIANFG